MTSSASEPASGSDMLRICGGRYDDAAAAYQVEIAAVRAAAADLQRRLKLSETCPW